MRTAFERTLAAEAALIVIGSDCPALKASHLRAAAEALAQHDAVLIPAEDGGYVLIGLALPIADLFEGVDWGSSAVMRQTRDRLAAVKVTSVELPALWDVDRPEDYVRLRREGLLDEVLS